MPDNPPAARSACNGDHHYAHHVRGGEPLSIPICTLCGEIGWADIREQIATHRAMVLAEAVQAIEDITGSLVCDWTKGEALASIRDLAEPGPETVPTSTRAAQNGPAVPASTPTPDGGAKAPARWRVGRKVGRTVYRQSGPDPADSDVLVGVMDTPELAAFAVEAMNRAGGDSDAT